MKYKYSAFTENTKEMREWLEELDYIAIGRLCKEYLVTIIEDGYGSVTNADLEDIDSDFYKETVNCRSNPQLFKAVAAVREGSDYLNHFICIKEGAVFRKGDFYMCIIEEFKNTFNDGSEWSKASLSELQEHFKIEKE